MVIENIVSGYGTLVGLFMYAVRYYHVLTLAYVVGFQIC